jgi:hypothetical protein
LEQRAHGKESASVRKLISLSLGVALATTVFLAVPASADSAIVVRDQGQCGMVGSDADGNVIFGGVGEITHIVRNGDHAVMTCKGRDIINDSGRGQHSAGFGCTVMLPGGVIVPADDSQATVSKSGEAMTKCRVSLTDV